ncbi:YybH family protein [Carboxylicivirga sp. RSCT41]|uniref:YybH family protein n=1 Tax=Carboxylicivirga agarovorans TaxID=3417570 RepID=UPI003D34223C
MKVIYLLVVSILLSACLHQTNENSVITSVHEDVKQTILEQMEASRQCWNKGDFEGYMQVYWQSDSLRFMGLNSLTKGWQSTLDNYKRGYPTADHRGVLEYRFKHFNQLSDDCVLVIGSFHLERSIGNAEGNFSLIWKRIDGHWKIIVDHT